ncbi:hypothetical protein GIB67_028842, partial [Kingdonia uniflora]
YILNKKVPLTASNIRKKELARERDLLTYRRKRKTIDPSAVVPPNTVDTANEGGSKFETEFSQATLEAQPPLLNVFPDSNMNIPIVGGYSQGEGATSNEDVGLSDKSLLRSFMFHRSETNSFHYKWGEMTPTLDDVEQLVGLPTDGDVTYLKVGGDGNSLSLRKLKEHYAYKLEKVLSDGTTINVMKENGLAAKSIARAYVLYALGSFLFPTKNGTDVSAWYLYLFSKDKVAKKWSWGSAALAHMYYNLGAASRDDGRQFACCTTQLEIAGIPKEMDSNVYEHCTCWKWDASISDRYSSTALLKFREALDNYKLEDPMPDLTLPKKYDDLLAAHEDVKKKLIAKEDFSQHRFPDVMKSLKTFHYKNPAFWKSIFSQTLGIQFTPDGENAYQILLQACSCGHQHVEYRHMTHLLSTYYEKVVVFISHTEAYTFLPLFWARKRNTPSNEEKLQNLLMDTSKYWWYGLGADNHYVRLFPRFDAPISLVSTIFYSNVNLDIPQAFLKEQLTRYFDVRVRNFNALLKEHNVKRYRVNEMVVVGLSTIK